MRVRDLQQYLGKFTEDKKVIFTENHYLYISQIIEKNQGIVGSLLEKALHLDDDINFEMFKIQLLNKKDLRGKVKKIFPNVSGSPRAELINENGIRLVFFENDMIGGALKFDELREGDEVSFDHIEESLKKGKGFFDYARGVVKDNN